MDTWIIDDEPGGKYPAWTRGNAGDVFPDPVSPLAVTFYVRPGLAQGWRDAYVKMGVYDYDEMENPVDPVVFAVFGGYLFNPLSLVRIFGARMPGATAEGVDKAMFDDRPDVPPYVAEPWHESERHAAKLTATMGWVLSTDHIPELDRDKAIADGLRASRPDLATFDVPALFARARSIVPYLRLAFETGMIVSTLSPTGPGVLSAICEGIGDPTIAIRLIAGAEVDSADPPKAMWQLSRTVRASQVLTSLFDTGVHGLDARIRASAAAGDAEAVAFVAAVDDFLFHYGSRCPSEWDFAAPSWEVRPDIALAAVDRMRFADDGRAPSTSRAVQVADRDRLIAEVRAKVAGDPETAAMFEAGLKAAMLFMSGRERYKANCIKLVNEMRVCFREAGRQVHEAGHLEHPDHIFMLLARELDEFQNHPERFTGRLAERWVQNRSLYDLEPPFALSGSVPPISTWKRRDSFTYTQVTSGTVLKGVAGSGGVATGRARVILHPSDPTDLDPGDVLVAPQTDPSWAPLFVSAAAVIVNVGALISHAMIVSRELGIPCVPSVENATSIIPDGAIVTVDGNAGTVTIH